MDFMLREWQMEDLPHLVKNANSKKIAETLRNRFPHPYTKEDGEYFLYLCKSAEASKELFYAITIDDIAVGSISLSRKDDIYCRTAELGYWVGEAFWGQGVATTAVKELCSKAFGLMDIVRIYSECVQTNYASQKVLERAGFQLEGHLRKSIFKNGVLLDSYIYGLTKGDFN